MAREKHLFPCRTQKLSLAAVTILGGYPWENSTVPFFAVEPREIEALCFCDFIFWGGILGGWLLPIFIIFEFGFDDFFDKLQGHGFIEREL